MKPFTIEHYLSPVQYKDIYVDCLKRLSDRQAKAAIIRRVSRIESGNFGDHRFCRDGVWELRVDTGPGYRVYYGMSGMRLVVLLCAGDKRKQDADITRAVEYWLDWQRRTDHA